VSTRCESVVTVMVVVVLLVGCGKAEPTVPPDSPRNTPIPPTDAASPTATLATESSVTNDTWLQRNLNPGEAVVWYLGHCGYAVRTQNHFLIFDYQERHDGREAKLRPAQPSLENGFIIPDEIKNLRVRVFATHEHEDHFDRVIFRWQETVPDIAYYFGWRASAADAPSFHYLITWSRLMDW
jgi:hypothetical protein